jgi:polysaccharide deacetylase family sporulation protein PdaB
MVLTISGHRKGVNVMNRRFKSYGTGLALTIGLMFLAALLPPNASAASSTVIRKVSTSKKVVAFTFDDCYSSSNVNAILSILKAHGIKATFFIVGDAAANNPSIVRAIHNAGMEIGNHSYTHTSYTSLSTSSMINDLNRCENTISNITGETTKPLFRPPGGAYNSTVLSTVGNAGYTKTILWNIDTNDWRGYSSSYIYNTVVNNISPGSIVIMHALSTATNTVYALPDIIDTLSSWGYSFTTVSGLIAGSSGSYSNGTSSQPILRLGSTGSAVRTLQQALVDKGYSLSVDGVFGPITQSAVMSFQRSVGITVDGIVGPVTWSKLSGSSGSTSTAYPGILKIGSSGSAVRTLQQGLVNKGYSLSVDGVFGPITQSAVMSFQRSQGITVDGIVGPVTWGRLF